MSSTSLPAGHGSELRDSNAPSTPASSDLSPGPEDHSNTGADSPPPNASNDDAGDGGVYGTRSRNRPRGARPNYADDREIDLEIEAAGKISKAPKKPVASSQATQQPQNVSSQPARNGFAAVNGTPASSTVNDAFHVNGSNMQNGTIPAISKKRKQPGSSTTVAQNTITSDDIRLSTARRAKFIASSVMSFTKCKRRLNSKKQLVADDGTVLQANDQVYLLCEPPGEPYYLCRIMEFLHEVNDPNNPIDAVRVNWFYRPKDIGRRVQDSRVVFASMHSDSAPLSSLRGKCTIQHLNDIPDLEEFRRQRDSFWFDKVFDRYMLRYYEVIPTSKVVNVPPHVKKVLDERWKFVLYEVGRGKELTSASKVCKRCQNFANNNDSVDCAHCKNTYHMSCVRPPLLKKPARGFAWSCAACARAQELRMEARHTPLSENELSKLAESESYDDDEDEMPVDQTRENSTGPGSRSEPTAEQLAHANMWLWRYLGIHSKPEDALDYDDRIYPRATSRQGPRHQANVGVWPGRPIEFIKPAEAKKKYKAVASKKDGKTASTVDNDKRPKQPKWVVNEPLGYIARGHDEPVDIKNKKEYTAHLTFKMPDPTKFTERGLDNDERPEDFDKLVDDYLTRCDNEIAPLFNLKAGNTDIRTKGLEKLQEHNYDVGKALEAMKKVSAKVDLKLPELTREEIKRFEEGVALYGSHLPEVARHISPNMKEGRIVRFYYMWKKTPKGQEIWGNYENRKSKKDSTRVEKDTTGTKLIDDVADDGDDSAFDEDKATSVKRGFKCKDCGTTHSRVWRRASATAPGTLVPRDDKSKHAKDRSNWLISALCGKCAYLWRRYAVKYESIPDLAAKIAVAGGRASKRKVDEELMRVVIDAHNHAGDIISRESARMASSVGVDIPFDMVESEEPPKKKIKQDGLTPAPEAAADKKKVVPDKPVELEPLKPEMPKVKEHPCAVCHNINHASYRMLKCRDCRLHVHAPCYGVNVPAEGGPWYCDMCMNDHNTMVSTNYECVLCPVRRTPQELMEPPKISHKKKTDREREKERAEREMVQEAGRRWREDQLAAGRPVDPREPLKRTAWNNWVHVNCAIWTKEIKFGDADHLDAAEGVGFISPDRYALPCKFCPSQDFPTVTCSHQGCTTTFHVGCAHQQGIPFGFDISPVKVSRRDSVVIMKLDQESGLAVPGIWCRAHAPPPSVHGMLEPALSGLTALQEYAHLYKQVDSSVTGTVRRAAQFQIHSKPPVNGSIIRRATVNGTGHADHMDLTIGTVRSPSPLPAQINGQPAHGQPTAKRCCTCGGSFSPKWYTVQRSQKHDPGAGQQINGIHDHSSTVLNGAAQSYVKHEPMETHTTAVPEEVLYQCHKCNVNKKTPPSSPSQIRRRELPPAEPQPAARTPPPPPPPPPLGLPLTMPHLTEGPPPSPHVLPGAPPHLSLYSGRPFAPPVLNGVPPPGMPYHPYARPEFRPYAGSTVHYPIPSGLPPPPLIAPPMPHSPPPAYPLVSGGVPSGFYSRPPPSYGLVQPRPSVNGPQVATPEHSRRPSEGTISTPRLSRPIGVSESPHTANLALPREGTPRDSESSRDDGRGSPAGPGASASPSLRNLLS